MRDVIRTMALTVVTAVSVFGVACGGGGDGATATAVNGVAVVDQDRLAFKPSKVTIRAGERVLFKNSESALHNVTIDGENVSGNMKRGDEFEFTATEAGVYRITCEFHPQMRATLTVE